MMVSSNDRAEEIEEKVREWLNFGILWVWVLYPKTRSIHVYDRELRPMILNVNDTLTGEDILTGFSAIVREFFD